MTDYPRWTMFILLSVHLGVTIAYVLKFFLEPPEWHSAWQAVMPSLDTDPVLIYDGSSRYAMYSRVVPPLMTQNACPRLPASAHTDTFSLASEPFAVRQAKMCRFGKVANMHEQAGSPYTMLLMLSGTPIFLLVTVQVAIFSHLNWTVGPIKLFARHSGWNRVLWPWDLMVSWLILAAWGLITVLVQKQRKIVYNNIVAAECVVLLTGLLQLFWSWRNSGAGSVGIQEEIDVDTEKDPNKTKSRLLMKMPVHMQPTDMPIVPASEQGTHHGTAHTVDNAVVMLRAYHLIALPRMLLLAMLAPLLSAAVMLKVGDIWRYSEIFYMSISAFMVFSLSAPLLSIVRITALHARRREETGEKADGKVVDDNVISGWLFISFFFLVATIVAVLAMVHYAIQVPFILDHKSVLAMIIIVIVCATLILAFSMLSLSSCGCNTIFAPESMWVLSELITFVISVAGLTLLVQ